MPDIKAVLMSSGRPCRVAAILAPAGRVAEISCFLMPMSKPWTVHCNGRPIPGGRPVIVLAHMAPTKLLLTMWLMIGVSRLIWCRITIVWREL
jgi:hypothetical protein